MGKESRTVLDSLVEACSQKYCSISVWHKDGDQYCSAKPKGSICLFVSYKIPFGFVLRNISSDAEAMSNPITTGA